MGDSNNHSDFNSYTDGMVKLGKPDIDNLPIANSEWREMIQKALIQCYSADPKVIMTGRVELEFLISELTRIGKSSIWKEEWTTFVWSQKGIFLERGRDEEDIQVQPRECAEYVWPPEGLDVGKRKDSDGGSTEQPNCPVG